jgi:hypothetical protein
VIILMEINEQEGQRGDESGGHRDGKSAEIGGSSGVFRQRGETIEPRESHRAANQIDQSNAPADVAKREQHSFGQQHRRGHAEGNDVRERIEFLPEGGFLTAETGEPAI